MTLEQSGTYTLQQIFHNGFSLKESATKGEGQLLAFKKKQYFLKLITVHLNATSGLVTLTNKDPEVTVLRIK